MTSGDFPIDITWLHDGHAINPSGRAAISTSKLGKRLSVLNIDSVEAGHAGRFSCVASNLAGAVEWASVLIVNGWCEIVIVMATVCDLSVSSF